MERPRTKWVVARDIRFVDALLATGTVVEELPEAAMTDEERRALRASRKRDEASEHGASARLVPVEYLGKPRFIRVGDIQLQMASTSSGGVLRRGRRGSSG